MRGTARMQFPQQDQRPDGVEMCQQGQGPARSGCAMEPPTNPRSSVDETLDTEKSPAQAYDFLAPAQGPDELGRLGNYRVLQVLGTGGMGVVFLAEDPALKRKVALKAMLPTLAVSASARQRFLREAQTVAAIEHDHIVAIHQVGEDRGVPFFAMPLLKGESLEERISRGGNMPVAEIVRIGREAA